MVKTQQKSKDEPPVKSASVKSASVKSARGIYLGVLACLLSLAGIVALLTYDIWGEQWIEIAGRSDTATHTPHTHKRLQSLSLETINIESRLQNLQQVLDNLKISQEQGVNKQEEFFDIVTNLQGSLAEQNKVIDMQAAKFSFLQEQYDSLWDRVSEQPQILSIVLGMVRERRKFGLALDYIPDLLDRANVLDIADNLRVFTDEAIPTDSELLLTYESLRPEIIFALGGYTRFPEDISFIERVKGFARSVVRVRKIGDDAEAESSPLLSLSLAIEARNFSLAYEFAKKVGVDSDGMSLWLARLELRHRADMSILALQDYLGASMLELSGSGFESGFENGDGSQ